MGDAIRDFSVYYVKAHPKRKLKWVFTQGTAEVVANLPRGRFTFALTTLQAVVLCLFNDDKESRTLQDIAAELNLAPELQYVLNRTLHPMSCRGSMNILSKTPPGPRISSDDIFRWNRNFSSRPRNC